MRLPSVFRPARSRSTRQNLLWTAAQSAAIWGLTLIVAPAVIVAVERRRRMPTFGFPYRAPAGLALFGVSSALNVWAGATLAARGRGTPLPLACPRTLVTSGPYRYVRNPMAVAGLGQGLGVAVSRGSWGVVAYVAAGGLLWHMAIRPVEERDLAARFGHAYEAYRAAVPLWAPLSVTGDQEIRRDRRTNRRSGDQETRTLTDRIDC
jgi:protein-S-isoprenylcysteine O-methyltransferase Ste14